MTSSVATPRECDAWGSVISEPKRPLSGPGSHTEVSPTEADMGRHRPGRSETTTEAQATGLPGDLTRALAVVPQARVELATFRLGGGCSIH